MSRWQAIGPPPPGYSAYPAAAGAPAAAAAPAAPTSIPYLPLNRPLTTVRASMDGSVIGFAPYNAQVPQVTAVRESQIDQANRLRADMRMAQKFEGGPLGMSAVLKNVDVNASRAPLYKAPGGRRTRKKHRRHRRKTRRYVR